MSAVESENRVERDVEPGVDAAAPAARFNVRDYARTSQGSHRDALNLETYAVRPLSPDLLESIAYLAALERGALTYLRSALAGPAHADARVTAFLVTWAYEKYWIADALEQVVAAHDVRPAVSSAEPGPLRRLARAVDDAVEPFTDSVLGNLIGDDAIAIHTLAGAIDDWILSAAYERLIARAEHRQLTATLTELRAVKRRHEEFFTEQSHDRFARSPRAARLARLRLRRTPWPLGADGASADLASHLLTRILTRGDVAAIDLRTAELLGTDSHLVESAARRVYATARRHPRPTTWLRGEGA